MEGVKAAILDFNHDDDIEVFLNGARLMKASGRTRALESQEISLDVFKEKAVKGENVIAVHVVRKGDKPCFDAALTIY